MREVECSNCNEEFTIEEDQDGICPNCGVDFETGVYEGADMYPNGRDTDAENVD